MRRRGGIGSARGAARVAAFRLGRLAADTVDEAPVLRGPEGVAAVALRELAGLRRERVIVLVCDGANRLRYVVTVADGSSDRSPFPVRAILQAVLRHDGKAFAVAHNHPSGDPTPSEADVEATRAIVEAARSVRVRFLEHVVVGSRDWRPALAIAHEGAVHDRGSKRSTDNLPMPR